jgi:hypothetical protein
MEESRIIEKRKAESKGKDEMRVSRPKGDKGVIGIKDPSRKFFSIKFSRTRYYM